jgi:hypothetical protein
MADRNILIDFGLARIEKRQNACEALEEEIVESGSDVARDRNE